MKITVDIDCTPAEARAFMGLPDVAPMQARMMEDLEKRLRDNLDQISPQAILQTWLSASPATLQEMFKRTFDLASGAKPSTK